MSDTATEARTTTDTDNPTVERTTRELRSIVAREMPGFELVKVSAARPRREQNIREIRPLRSLSGRASQRSAEEPEFSDKFSEYYIRVGNHTYRVYVRPAAADEPAKSVTISTVRRSILSMQG